MHRIHRLLFCVLPLFGAACGGGGGAPPVDRQVAADIVPPTTVVTPEDGSYGVGVEVEFQASEPAVIHVSTNGGPFLAAGESPVRITLGEGVTNLRYYAVDSSGNVEERVQSGTYRIDLSPPLLTLVEGDPAPFPWMSEVQVPWRCDEACTYTITRVDTDEVLEQGEREPDATSVFRIAALDLPDEPVLVRLAAADSFERSSEILFELRRADAVAIAVDEVPGDVVVPPPGDRAFVARRFDTSVDVVDLETGEIVSTIDVGLRAWTMTLHPEGTHVYVANGQAPGAIAVIDVESLAVASVEGDVGIPGAVGFSGDGAYGFFTDFDGGVRVLDADPSSNGYLDVLDTIAVNDAALTGRVAANGDGTRLVVNWRGTGFVGLSVVEIGSGGPDVTLAWMASAPAVSALTQAVIGSADGERAYLSSTKLLCGLCRFDIDDDQLVHAGDDPHPAPDAPVVIGGLGNVPDVPWALALLGKAVEGDGGAVSGDEEHLLAVGANGKFVRLYDAKTMKHLSRHRIGAGAASIAATPDGKRAVITRASGNEREILVLPLK